MSENPNKSANDNVFGQINSICKEYRRLCKRGDRPRIESCLMEIAGEARSTLFSNLLQIELDVRRRAGESPDADEYRIRFPHFSAIIRQAFFESTMMSQEANQGTPADSGGIATRTIDWPSANRLGEYVLLGELGRDGFGAGMSGMFETESHSGSDGFLNF